MDKIISELTTTTLKDVWLTCNLCGARIKAGNVPKHIAKVHPKTSGNEDPI